MIAERGKQKKRERGGKTENRKQTPNTMAKLMNESEEMKEQVLANSHRGSKLFMAAARTVDESCNAAWHWGYKRAALLVC